MHFACDLNKQHAKIKYIRHLLQCCCLFADDTVITSLATEPGAKYCGYLDDFDVLLQLNTKKTKDFFFNFIAIRQGQQQVVVSGNCTEFVNEYKYIGIVIDEKLSWESSISVI